MTTDRNQTPMIERPFLSIPEVQKLLRWGRDKVSRSLDTNGGPFKTVQDGARRKVLTPSIIAHVDQQTRMDRDCVGLTTETKP